MTAAIGYNLRRNKELLEEALSNIHGVKEKLLDFKDKDLHCLYKWHEVMSMMLCSELTFKAALMKNENRGFHYREDYPARNYKAWLKWIILKSKGNKINLSTQLIPIENMPSNPKLSLLYDHAFFTWFISPPKSDSAGK